MDLFEWYGGNFEFYFQVAIMGYLRGKYSVHGCRITKKVHWRLANLKHAKKINGISFCVYKNSKKLTSMSTRNLYKDNFHFNKIKCWYFAYCMLVSFSWNYYVMTRLLPNGHPIAWRTLVTSVTKALFKEPEWASKHWVFIPIYSVRWLQSFVTRNYMQF